MIIMLLLYKKLIKVKHKIILYPVTICNVHILFYIYNDQI